MYPDIETVLKLQSLDLRTLELQKEIATLPKHIAVIEKTLDSHTKRLDADRAALAGNQKERKKLEGEAQVQEQKMSKLRDQMFSAKTNEQAKAFQNEIQYCENEIRKSEDRILELMAESEPLEKNVKAAEVSLSSEKQQVETEKKAARERTAADQQQLAETERERKALFSTLNPGVAALYNKLRRRGTVIAAEVVNERCGACHISVRPQHFQDLKKAEGILTCESCGRILYYNPPVSFEDQIQAPVSHAQAGPAK